MIQLKMKPISFLKNVLIHFNRGPEATPVLLVQSALDTQDKLVKKVSQVMFAQVSAAQKPLYHKINFKESDMHCLFE